MDDTFTRMISATAALAAVATMLAGTAGAYPGLPHGARSVPSQSEARSVAVIVPYLSHGVGIDASRVAGQAARPPGVHAALIDRRSPPSAAQSLGLNGDSPLTRVSAPEPEGLTGDGALTRLRKTAPPTGVPGGNDIDWTSFGAGAGMVALAAAGLVGILLTVRRRHTVGMP